MVSAAEPFKPGTCEQIISYYKSEALYVKDCCILLFSNFTADLTTNFGIVRYPFLGVWEVLHSAEYGYSLLFFFLTYLVAYMTMLLFYFIFLFPFTVAAYGVFGPIGFLLALLHGILFSNIEACYEVRSDTSHYMLNLLRFTFTRHNMSSVLLCPDTLHLRPEDSIKPWSEYLKSAEFWTGTLPIFLLQRFFMLIIFFVWYLISLVPIAGIILLKFHNSPHRGFSYVLPFYRDIRKYDKRALARIYYGGYARWLLLGASTGILEFIPILAGIALCTNSAGCALWEIKQVKNHRME
ncbi:YOL047C [Zygosaccharomyces parabailii]|nr:YOL047C [Zygosaccharomyces parabailii]CDH10658.1 uncharacterized protein ZBAI_02444 [Zygosaccharomyces bailii ISA1307]